MSLHRSSRPFSPLHLLQTRKPVADSDVNVALKKGEEVEVLGMAPEDDCMKEMFVMISFCGRKLGVPLAELEPVKPNKAIREAMEDWRYWIAMGYEF